MDDKIKAVVIDVLAPVSADVVAFRVCGSSACGFIREPRNADVIVVCKNEESKKRCRQEVRHGENGASEKLKAANIILYFVAQEDEEKALYESAHPYLLLHGEYFTMDGSSYEKNVPFSEFLSKRQKIKGALMKIINDLLCWNVSNDVIYRSKIWYQIYITACMLYNESETLTQEQELKANLLHGYESDLEAMTKLVFETIANVRSL